MGKILAMQSYTSKQLSKIPEILDIVNHPFLIPTSNME
jgi:hypothetical protein